MIDPLCGEEILPGERTSPMSFYPANTVQQVHSECAIRGALSHAMEECYCFKPGRSLREEAKATWVKVVAMEAANG